MLHSRSPKKRTGVLHKPLFIIIIAGEMLLLYSQTAVKPSVPGTEKLPEYAVIRL